MEEFSHLGDSGGSGGDFTTSPTPPQRAAVCRQGFRTPPLNTEAGSSQSQKRRIATQEQGESSPSDVEEDIKSKIMSHPHYSTLVEAFMDCQKVGAPPEVVARLSTIAREIALGPSCHNGTSDPDPELDRFMESYCDVLIKYREELTRPLQEAKDFLMKMESQFNALTDASTRGLFSTDEKCEGFGSSEEDQNASWDDQVDPPEIDPHGDKELKRHLLKKYGGYLSRLRQELSKKKKKGKLPKDARQKLLNWWQLHYKWPYPSETEKVELAESTGLDQKQINNWFINQRKRHWKPSEDMQFVVMDGFYPQNAAAALYMEGQFMGDGVYHLGP
ncbi:hypothetical protein OPV22_024100 [Ensete ventricosum]|uniref:Homeobox domain-containing protein n=1 Tax=Ensete ventricosum TaxID=4639 RepID=A0AAV8QYF6_ENSVE|nr:hypothetical protein OPV22_024100 [Ensete ventricosum]